MKKKYHDPLQPVDKQGYKKSYLVRKFQEQEAEEEIKQYEDCADGSETDRQYGERFVGRERRSGKLS